MKCTPSYGKFQCPLTGVCISIEDVCNNKADCQSSNDEGIVHILYLITITDGKRIINNCIRKVHYVIRSVTEHANINVLKLLEDRRVIVKLDSNWIKIMFHVQASGEGFS